MSAEKHTVRVTIGGTEYPVQADADPAYIQTIAAYVDRRMHEIPGAAASQSLAGVAILTALNIADELHKERQEKETALNSLDERLAILIRRLDQALDLPHTT